MTSREEIALRLTLDNLSVIQRNTKISAAGMDNEVLANEFKEFYNYLFDNIKTSDNDVVEPKS